MRCCKNDKLSKLEILAPARIRVSLNPDYIDLQIYRLNLSWSVTGNQILKNLHNICHTKKLQKNFRGLSLPKLMYKKLQPKHVLKVGVISFPIASVMSQTQNGPKHEKLSLQEKLYGIFFFFFLFHLIK